MVWVWLILGVAWAQEASTKMDQEKPPMVDLDIGVIPDDVADIARAVANKPLAVRMKAISDAFLGVPYVVNGNGEGVGPDTDPPARYDVFDCLTVIEEVLALAYAGDPVSAPMWRNAIRYQDGIPSYQNRHHFMLAEWIPANIAAGFFEDITHTLGETHRVEKTVTKSTWANWRGTRSFDIPIDDLPTGTYGINVLSLDAALQAADQIPPGAIILTLRRSDSWRPIIVKHVGFMVPSDVRPTMRHATMMSGGQVKDHSLVWYLNHVRWYKYAIEGITVLMPLEQGPRRVLVETGE